MKTELHYSSKVSWVPYDHDIQIFAVDGELDIDEDLITTVFCIGYESPKMNESLLLVKDKDRGWNTPGGHRIPGETLEETLRREVWEESRCKILQHEPIGYQKLTLLEDPGPDYKYPSPVSYQLFYECLVKPEKFEPSDETTDRIFVNPVDLFKMDDINPDLCFALVRV